ncbi:MAG: pyrroline-5-carboxylate reductase [Methylococcaceae bacterium]|jgi:pyrroline-5-carboxylate reductase
MKQNILGFIGAGNMATSLIGGLIADGYPGAAIWVSDINEAGLNALAERHGVNVTTDNSVVAEHADILVLAVKPQILKAVCTALAPTIATSRPLVVSIAAGITIAPIDRWLGGDAAIVRCMPNTPAMVMTGATGLFANTRTSSVQRSQAEAILRAVGLTVWVDDEALLDAVTALSGSGPAYYFLFMEAMEAEGVRLGLSPEVARLLTQQTALGAGRIAIESAETPAELRRRVTSPGGTTEQAINCFEKGGLRSLVGEAMAAAARRAAELSKLLGE